MDRSAHLRSLLSTVLAAEDPAERLIALAGLRRELDTTETELAADALRAGMSWSQIGGALGVSKQAAHRRHRHGVTQLDRAAETQHHGSRAIVSGEARQAVRIARAEAATLGRQKVGTEHLLLGLLQCGDARTVEVLKRLGVTLALAREAVQPTAEMSLDAGAQAGLTGNAASGELDGQVPAAAPAPAAAAAAEGVRPSAVVSPLARRVLERALTPAAGRAGSLTALDLLQALLRHDNGGATRTLAVLGVDALQVQDEITRVDQLSRTPSAAPANPGGRRQARSRPV
jgi:ATP-dependent Clp protease ATP-binding subunit ClpA